MDYSKYERSLEFNFADMYKSKDSYKPIYESKMSKFSTEGLTEFQIVQRIQHYEVNDGLVISPNCWKNFIKPSMAQCGFQFRENHFYKMSMENKNKKTFSPLISPLGLGHAEYVSLWEPERLSSPEARSANLLESNDFEELLGKLKEAVTWSDDSDDKSELDKRASRIDKTGFELSKIRHFVIPTEDNPCVILEIKPKENRIMMDKSGMYAQAEFTKKKNFVFKNFLGSGLRSVHSKKETKRILSDSSVESHWHRGNTATMKFTYPDNWEKIPFNAPVRHPKMLTWYDPEVFFTTNPVYDALEKMFKKLSIPGLLSEDNILNLKLRPEFLIKLHNRTNTTFPTTFFEETLELNVQDQAILSKMVLSEDFPKMTFNPILSVLGKKERQMIQTMIETKSIETNPDFDFSKFFPKGYFAKFDEYTVMERLSDIEFLLKMTQQYEEDYDSTIDTELPPNTIDVISTINPNKFLLTFSELTSILLSLQEIYLLYPIFTTVRQSTDYCRFFLPKIYFEPDEVIYKIYTVLEMMANFASEFIETLLKNKDLCVFIKFFLAEILRIKKPEYTLPYFELFDKSANLREQLMLHLSLVSEITSKLDKVPTPLIELLYMYQACIIRQTPNRIFKVTSSISNAINIGKKNLIKIIKQEITSIDELERDDLKIIDVELQENLNPTETVKLLRDTTFGSELESFLKSKDMTTFILRAPTGLGKTVGLINILGRTSKVRSFIAIPTRSAILSMYEWMKDQDLGFQIGYQMRDSNSGNNDRDKVTLCTVGTFAKIFKSNINAESVYVMDEFHDKGQIKTLYDMCASNFTKGNRSKIILSSATMETGTLIGKTVVFNVSSKRTFVPEFDKRVQTDRANILKSESSKTSVEQFINEILKATLKVYNDLVTEYPEQEHAVLVMLPGEKYCKDAKLRLDNILHLIQEPEFDFDLDQYPKVKSMKDSLTSIYTTSKKAVGNLNTMEKYDFIFSTNQFENSLTIDYLTGVVDSALRKVNHYNVTTKVTELKMEPASKSNIKQCIGRVGRIPGKAAKAFLMLPSLEYMELPEYGKQEREIANNEEDILNILDNDEDPFKVLRIPNTVIHQTMKKLYKDMIITDEEENAFEEFKKGKGKYFNRDWMITDVTFPENWMERKFKLTILGKLTLATGLESSKAREMYITMMSAENKYTIFKLFIALTTNFFSNLLFKASKSDLGNISWNVDLMNYIDQNGSSLDFDWIVSAIKGRVHSTQKADKEWLSEKYQIVPKASSIKSTKDGVVETVHFLDPLMLFKICCILRPKNLTQDFLRLDSDVSKILSANPWISQFGFNPSRETIVKNWELDLMKTMISESSFTGRHYFQEGRRGQKPIPRIVVETKTKDAQYLGSLVHHLNEHHVIFHNAMFINNSEACLADVWFYHDALF
ncbi:putative ATP-dependent RNA helicase [Carp edema virus]|nr:putative ATP-dependent RNA helicase [Carp edema virus]